MLAFLSVSTQWRVAGMGGVMGLDYTACRNSLELDAITITPDLWAGVKVMERAAIPVINDKDSDSIDPEVEL